MQSQSLRTLRDAADKVVVADENTATAVYYRDDRIRRAHEGGMTIRKIANATGLSPARIHQIIQQVP